MHYETIGKSVGTDLSSKYGQKLIGTIKVSATDAHKTISNTALQKTVEAKGDLV